MKKVFSFAIYAMAALAMTLALSSCKKENPNAMLGSASVPAKVFSPPKVDDMNAYLKDYKQKMQTVTRGDDEMLSLEEAAWHLSSVANYDFANANVSFDDIRFDTLHYQMSVTNGQVSLTDLNTVYANVSSDIDAFYHSLDLHEKHFRFINSTISHEGIITVALLTTFKRSSRGTNDLEDHLWYYEDYWDLQVECNSFCEEYETLPASTTGRDLLERFLNWKLSHGVETRYYYTITSYEEFYYRDEIDPYGSPNFMASRLFANNGGLNMDIKPRFCYLCDSNLGLGSSNCPQGLYVIHWKVFYRQEPPYEQFQEHFWKEHYIIRVAYGERHEYTIGTGGINY